MNEQIRPAQEIDVAPVFVMNRDSPRRSVQRVKRMGFVIGDIHQRGPARIKAVGQRQGGMVRVAQGRLGPAQRKGSLAEVGEANCRSERFEVNRKIAVGHLPGEGSVQLIAHPAGAVDVPLVSGNKKRNEKREPLDVVPVGMGDEDIALHVFLSRGHQLLIETVDAGATVEDIQRSVVHDDLNAGRIPAVAEGSRPRFRQGPANAPKPNSHTSSLPTMPSRRAPDPIRSGRMRQTSGKTTNRPRLQSVKLHHSQ